MGGLLIIFNGFNRFTATPLTGTLSFSGLATKRTRTSLAGNLAFATMFTTLHKHFLVLTANLISSARISSVKWYMGTFTQISKGFFRAVYRGYAAIITQDRNQI